MTELTFADFPTSVIDVDTIPDSSLPTTITNKDDRIRCHGFKIHAEPGHSLYSDYPFNIHAHHSLPWTIQITGEEMVLRAENCIRFCYADPCVKCLGLRKSPILSGILQRMSVGAKEHTPWIWLSHAQLQERAHRLERQVNSLKLHALNTGNKLARRTTVLDDHKRFVMSIATGVYSLSFSA